MVFYFIFLALLMAVVLVVATLTVQRYRSAVVIGIMLFGAYFVATAGALRLQGLPKSVENEVEGVETAQVLWAGSVDRKRICLLLTWDGQPEPRYYWMPWSQEMEQQINKARQNAIARRQPLMVRRPFDGGLLRKMLNGSGNQVSTNGSGPPGQGPGGGYSLGDNEGTERMFYAPPPERLPEKLQ